jgi:hippurate hydrolase
MRYNLITVPIIILLLISSLQAQNIKEVKQMAYADSGRLTEIFKDIHQNPELGFMEVRTSAIVAKELMNLGYDVITGIGGTGVAAILKNGPGLTVMYRADMDCNSVREITGLAYASAKTMKKDDGTETPVMHACGHDAHITWMIGIAKIMVTLKNDWKGTLVFIAQPAEELGLGAKAMIDDGMYKKGVPVPDYLIGLHTWNFEVGKIDNAGGVRMAGSDQLDVTFYGVGGHGAMPENTKDPIIMACNAVMQYQTIISRNIAAQDVAVLTVGSIQAGTDNNVIPTSATIKVNIRWFNDSTRKILLDGIKRINEGIAVANGLSKDQYPTIKMKGYYTPLVNDVSFTNKINTALNNVLKTENIMIDKPAVMVSEDFQQLLIGVSTAKYDYIRVGVANEAMYYKAIQEGKKAPFFNHGDNFEADLSVIPMGTEIGACALLAAFRK